MVWRKTGRKSLSEPVRAQANGVVLSCQIKMGDIALCYFNEIDTESQCIKLISVKTKKMQVPWHFRQFGETYPVMFCMIYYWLTIMWPSFMAHRDWLDIEISHVCIMSIDVFQESGILLHWINSLQTMLTTFSLYSHIWLHHICTRS